MVISDLHVDPERLREVSNRYSVARLEVFGSFARGDAGPDSDLDVLVTFEPGAQIGFGFIALKEDLEELFGRPVDLLTRASVEQSPNKYFRHYALACIKPLYEPA